MVHKNVITGDEYTFGNGEQLDFVYKNKGFSEAIWGTYLQFRKLGGQVKKGEKGTLLRHPVSIPNGTDSDGNKKFKSGMKHFHVFNLEQVLFHPETEKMILETVME